MECRSVGRLCDTCEVNALDCGCSADEDCANTGFCGPSGCFSCQNGVKDGFETDVDCGGSRCNTCDDGSFCIVHGDCASGSCLDNACVDCFNNLRDGDETGLNCGGSCAQTCAEGQGCNDARDCSSGNCADGTCAAPLPSTTCNDGQLGELETDVDCGGVECVMLGKSCTAQDDNRGLTSQSCLVGSDCDSGMCSGADPAAKVCVSCSNRFQDVTETDVDCGGDCDSCADGSSCNDDSDCLSGMCYTDGTCVSYFNGVRDGAETDVDCGGSAPAQCVKDRSCGDHTDCVSGNCDSGTCVDPSADQTCYDGQLGELETDVDCGGTPCVLLGKVCASGQGCSVDADCAGTAQCSGGACSACDDGTQNGDETGVDCGGGCALCPDNESCLADGDCQSGSCSGYWALSTPTCIRPGTIGLRAPSTSLTTRGSDTISNALWIDIQNAPTNPADADHTAACTVEVRLDSSNETHIHFEQPIAGEPCYNQVRSSWATADGRTSDSSVSLRGPVECVSNMLSAFGVDTSCSTPWGFEGAKETGNDDRTFASVAVEITDVAQCSLYETRTMSVDLGIEVQGRLQVDVVGYIVSAKCRSKIPDAPPDCKNSAIAGANIVGAVNPCHLQNSCVDESPFPLLTCSQLVAFGMATCGGDAGTANPAYAGTPFGAMCAQTCDNCPDTGGVFATESGGLASERGTAGPLKDGAFELAIAFSPTDAFKGAIAMVTVSAPGYENVVLTLPLQNNILDVGNVYMPEEAPKAKRDLKGVCLDASFLVDEVPDNSMIQPQLKDGVAWFPLAPINDPPHNPPQIVSPDAQDPETGEFRYSQTSTQLGAKTLSCGSPSSPHFCAPCAWLTCADCPGGLGNSTATQYVVSNGQAFGIDPMPMLVAQPSSGFTIVLSWVDLGNPQTATDLDLHTTFMVDTTSDGQTDSECHVFYGVTECSDAKHLRDGPFTVDGPFNIPIGDEVAPTEIQALSEAISLEQIYATVYTFYAHNPTAVSSGLNCVGGDDCTQLIDVAAEVYGTGGKVLDVRAYIQSSADPYLRLFCIDGMGAISAAVKTTAFRSEMCRACPC